MNLSEELIHRFYQAFQQGDYRTMQSCYHEQATFHDPVFKDLGSAEVKAMWQMLVTSAKDLKITFSHVRADERTGACNWEATYTFSRTGRPVHNIISATMNFRDGKILRHVDRFSLWRWSRQALGITGVLLGWSPIVGNKVSATAKRSLAKFSETLKTEN